MNYTEMVSETWRHRELGGSPHVYRELVRYATLAASSHNTQSPGYSSSNPTRYRCFRICRGAVPPSILMITIFTPASGARRRIWCWQRGRLG